MKRPLSIGYRTLLAISIWYAATVIGGIASKSFEIATNPQYQVDTTEGLATQIVVSLVWTPIYSLIAGLNPWVLLIFITFIGLIQYKSRWQKLAAVLVVTTAVIAIALGINNWLGGLPDAWAGNHLLFSTFVFLVLLPALATALVLSPKASIDNHFQ